MSISAYVKSWTESCDAPITVARILSAEASSSPGRSAARWRSAAARSRARSPQSASARPATYSLTPPERSTRTRRRSGGERRQRLRAAPLEGDDASFLVEGDEARANGHRGDRVDVAADRTRDLGRGLMRSRADEGGIEFVETRQWWTDGTAAGS